MVEHNIRPFKAAMLPKYGVLTSAPRERDTNPTAELKGKVGKGRLVIKETADAKTATVRAWSCNGSDFTNLPCRPLSHSV